MLTLEKIVVQDFRNIELQELEFSPNVNCIWGNNGEGKTNLMDAIHYISMTKSAFGSADRFNFRYGTSSFSIAGTYMMPSDIRSVFTIRVDDGAEKKLRRDGKPYTRISDHIGVLPVVMVSPSDIALVSESGEERRRFVNSVLSQLDREYLAAMQQYNRILMQRNRLLKEGVADDALLSVFDVQLSSLATPIWERRARFVSELAPVVEKYYAALSSSRERVSISYRSDLERGPLIDALAGRRERDKALKYTTAGVQRDDFIFEMEGYPIRRCGSQGQQKSFLVSLKFAQYEVMKQRYGYPPILLLDDLFDKLDINRVSNLLRMVSGSDFGQIFISDTDRGRISGIVDSLTEDSAFFETAGGQFRRQ